MKHADFEHPNIELKNGSIHDLVFITELFDKLRRLKAKYINDSQLSYETKLPPLWSEEYNTVKQQKEEAKNRSDEINELFNSLHQSQSDNVISESCIKLLQSYHIIPTLNDEKFLRALKDIIHSGVSFTDNTLTSPFMTNGFIKIQGIELAEIILAMYRFQHPYPNRPHLNKVTLDKTREYVKRIPPNYDGRRYFDWVDLGAGPIMFKLVVSHHDTCFNIGEYNGNQPLAQIAIAQVLRRKMHFCQFTGYTKGLIEILGIHHDEEKGIYEYTVARPKKRGQV